MVSPRLVALVAVVAVLAAACASGDRTDEQLKGMRPIKYGSASSQLGELLLPNELGPHPVVVLLHGGWWRESDFDRRLMRALADDLSDRGYATWNLEYRLVGEEGGGWPGTFEDVAAGIDELAEIAPQNDLDLSRVVVVGHSAGGTLALWAAARGTLPEGAVGADPEVEATGAIALAPVTDLAASAAFDLGAGAVRDLLGGLPDEVPERYDWASPRERLPLGTPAVVVHGTADDVVPFAQTQAFVEASEELDEPVELVELDDVDHFEVIDPDHDAWQAVLDVLDALDDPRPSDDR